MLIWNEITKLVEQYPADYQDYLNGGHAWERSEFYTAVYAALVAENLMPYEVASSGDPYELVGAYLIEWRDSRQNTAESVAEYGDFFPF